LGAFAIYEYKEYNKEVRISSIELSKSAKHLLFISLQTDQKIQIGTIFQATTLLVLPEEHQQAHI
jgi:hypothetical protein